MEQEQERERGPIDYVQEDHELSDDEMFQLFGTDASTQAAMIRERPELRRAVEDMKSLIG